MPDLIAANHPMHWFIKSNLYVALCAASLAYVTYAALDVPTILWWPPPPAALLLGCATLFVYNLDRLSPAAVEDLGGEDLLTRTPPPALHRLMIGMMVVSIPGMIWCAWKMPWHLVLALMPAAFIATGYALPLVYWRGRWRRLKEIPGLKIVLIALVWSIATVSIPAWEQGIAPWGAGALDEALSRALFIFAITLPFDVRDMERDARAGIITIPGLLGVPRTRWLALSMLGVIALLQALQHGTSLTSHLWPALLTLGITAALIARLRANQPGRYYAVYMEGMMGTYALLACAWELLT